MCVLFEGGEHGKLAARLATQVIKAYVDKQRRQPTKMAAGSGKMEVSSLWTDPSGTNEDADHLQAGHFLIDVGRNESSAGDGCARAALTDRDANESQSQALVIRLIPA